MDSCITVWHWPDHDRWYDEGVRQSLRMIRDAGFTHINWNPDAGSSYIYAPSEIAFIRDLVAESGLRTHSVHASNGRNRLTEMSGGAETRKDILSPHDWQRQAGVDLIRNRLDLAAALGSPDVVLHIDISDDTFSTPDRATAFLTPLFASLDDLRDDCLRLSVRIAVETLFIAGADAWLDLYAALFDRYPADMVGMCFDAGHWELVEPGALTVLNRFGDRLIATHIHDNFGAKDDHLLPFDGRLNWDAITAAIAATPYVTPLNLETPQDRYAMPPAAFYRRAHAAAVRLERMIAQHRGQA
ncbi:sugar phosphate isomerase/epimerase [Paracoccus sp. (in: a-proteobacteria)]|uniref:sugar phosphate isomerase/epimerase family protein n=1 Tax=Paracoccus sp. TaxID=267 RepID=UPI0026E05EF1|nr:TIM barrel protein [Paracoccus sp. (in: a-proteobacteria)]MDO5648798.1 TIM barrel protein [Paracoccus sp. (in: a-proteobacteria)]